MCRKRLLCQSLSVAKAHRCNSGTLQQNYEKWTYNVIKSKAFYARNIAAMTKMPYESTMSKVVMKSYEKSDSAVNKVTVVGTGEAAIASSFALLAKGVTRDVCLIGVDDNKLKGEERDLKYGSSFLNGPKITASKEHSASVGSKICVVAAGTEPRPYESEYDFKVRNTGIVRAVTPELKKYCPEAVYLIASDPVDMLTYQAWRASGIPESRIMGTGTNLDSARFQYMIADRLRVDPGSCLGVVVGRSSCSPCEPCVGGGRGGVPVWSEASACGVRLMDLNPKIGAKDDPERWQECYNVLIEEEECIRKVKGGYTWALALSIANICEAILTNSQSVHPVSIYAKGKYSIKQDVFISLPCVLGINGIVDVVRLPLSRSETTLLHKDARTATEAQHVLKILQ